MLLKQSTTRSAVVFMTDSSDHVSGKTGLTLTITASKDGGSFASISPTVTELATGWYKLALTASHTDTLGYLALHITGSGADATDHIYQVVVDLPGASVSSIASGGITSASFAADSITAAAIADDVSGVVYGTADSGTTTTMVDAARTEADSDYWKGNYILFTSGTISGQCRLITTFTPASDTITFSPATTQAVSTNTYQILPSGVVQLAAITHTSATIPTVSTVTNTVNADVVSISGDSTAADNAESFFDGTGYAGTGNTIPTTTTVTNVVSANVTQISGDSTSADNLESYTDGTTPMPVNATQISGDSTAADNAESFFDGTGYAGTNNVIPTTTTVTNVVSANVTQISSDSTAADNAESFFDGTGYAGTNNVIPTVTTTTSVTNTVNANAIQISGDSTAADNAESFFDGTGYAGTGNTIPTVTDVTTKTGYRLSATGVDDVWDETASGHTTSGTFGQVLQPIRSATAQGGASSTITLDGSASATNDLYNTSLIYITAGTGVGQARIITDYVGSSKIATVSENWTTNPSSDSVFVVLPFGFTPASSGITAADVWGYATRTIATVTGNVDGSVGSVGSGGITAASIATGAIDADALATDAVTEIINALIAKSGFTAAGTITVGETLRLMVALAKGKVTLISSNTYRVYDDDGTTKVVDFTQTTSERTPS